MQRKFSFSDLYASLNYLWMLYPPKMKILFLYSLKKSK